MALVVGMDTERFRNGMNLLSLLPNPGGPLDEEGLAVRASGYLRLFAEDDGDLFVRACERGVGRKWRFFPSPYEIREQMDEIVMLERAARIRLETEEKLRLTAEKAARDQAAWHAPFLAKLGGEGLSLEGKPTAEEMATLNERDAATRIVIFAEELLRRSKRPQLGDGAAQEA